LRRLRRRGVAFTRSFACLAASGRPCSCAASTFGLPPCGFLLQAFAGRRGVAFTRLIACLSTSVHPCSCTTSVLGCLPCGFLPCASAGTAFFPPSALRHSASGWPWVRPFSAGSPCGAPASDVRCDMLPALPRCGLGPKADAALREHPTGAVASSSGPSACALGPSNDAVCR